MSIAYISRHYSAESGNLGDGTYANPFRNVENPAITTWLSTAEPGSVLCDVDAMFGATVSGPLIFDMSDFRSAAKPGRPLIFSGDPARWGDAPAGAARAQRFGYKALSPSFTQLGVTGVYEATISGLRPLAGLAFNIDTRSDRAGTAQRDTYFERPTLVFHPQDCWAVPHTCCRTRKVTPGAVVAGNTIVLTYPNKSPLTTQSLTVTAVASGALDTPNSPGAKQFVIGGDAATTAANIAAVVTRALPLTNQVTDNFSAGTMTPGSAIASWWTAGGGSVANDDKCGTGSGYTLQIADAAHGVWKTGQTKSLVQIRLKLRIDSASATINSDSLSLELCKNATSGETFRLWLTKSIGNYYIGANTSSSTTALNTEIAVDTPVVIEACFDSDKGTWWLWKDGVEIVTNVAGAGPVMLTDIGVKSYAGSGAATNWRVYIDDVRVWYEDTAQPHTRHMSAWASGDAVYFPQLIVDVTTLTATNCTVTSDVWLVHLGGEADPSGKTWYGADSSKPVDLYPRAQYERVTDIVIADVDTIASANYNGLLASSAIEHDYPYNRMWVYRTRITRPAFQCHIKGQDIIYDRVRWFDVAYVGPYYLMLNANRSYDTDPAFKYSKGFYDNILVNCGLYHCQLIFSGPLWNAGTLCSPDQDSHCFSIQASRGVTLYDYQVRSSANLVIWFGGTANNFDSSPLCPTHRPDIGGDDRTFWVPSGRTNQIIATCRFRFLAVEDIHRRIYSKEQSTDGKEFLTFEQNGVPIDMSFEGLFIRGWPYGAPYSAIRFYPAVSGLSASAIGARVKGAAALWCGHGVKVGGQSAPALWPFFLYDTANPEKPITPVRLGVEQRRRPGAQWLGFYEESATQSVTKFAVAFTPSAPILAADMAAAGALKVWLRKTGAPADITVAIGAGATPDVAAATYTGTIAAASVSTAAAGAEFAVTLTGSGDLAAGVKHWIVFSGVTASSSNANYYQMFGWWGGRHSAFPVSDYRSGVTPAWAAESTDFSPYFTLATLGHAPSSAFATHTLALGSSSANAKIAQRFRTTGAFRVSGFSAWVAGPVTANQASNMPVAIYTDSGGEPGTLVKKLLPMNDTMGNMPSWATHQAGNAVYAFPPRGCDLAANTDYWIVIDAPQINATNYYRMFGTLDGAADGYGAKVWDGAAWSWADGSAQSAAKLYYTFWQTPDGATQYGPIPAVSVDDVMVVSPRPTRNNTGTWDVENHTSDRRPIAAGGVLGAVSAFFYVPFFGNRYAGGSTYDDWILTTDYDDAARPKLRGMVAVGKSPSFTTATTNPNIFPAESADPWDASGGTSGFFRYCNFELAANLGASEVHRGQLTPAQWAERSRAAGAEWGRDLMAFKGA